MMNNTWKLFLDDIRDPIGSDYLIARSSEEAIRLISTYGIPQEICFDHDLGGDDTAMKVIDFLEHLVYDCAVILPVNFTYSVHSQNPVGKANIIRAMECLTFQQSVL